MTDAAALAADLRTPLDFPRLLEVLHARKFTGQITLNVGQGCVVSASIPEKPLIIPLTQDRNSRKI